MAGFDHEAEVLRLRQRIAALMDEAAHNERLLKKTRQRELELLNTADLLQFMEVVCQRMAQSFGLPAVRLVLVDQDHELRHRLYDQKVSAPAQSGPVHSSTTHSSVVFLESAAYLHNLFREQRAPLLGPYSVARHSLVFGQGAQLGSVALIPLGLQSRLQGLIGFGSPDERRFTRQLATDFLEQLGVTASFALENVLNRARLVQNGMTDFLTGWHNRRYLEERLKEELARAARSHLTLACIVLDLDHFKTINDTHGHLAGDAALRETAQRLRHQVRDSDTAARFGGDEFVVLAPEISRQQVEITAERMRQSMMQRPLELPDGGTLVATVTVGVGLLSVASLQHEQLEAAAAALFAAADAALYRAKQRGRNCVEVSELVWPAASAAEIPARPAGR